DSLSNYWTAWSIVGTVRNGKAHFKIHNKIAGGLCKCLENPSASLQVGSIPALSTQVGNQMNTWALSTFQSMPRPPLNKTVSRTFAAGLNMAAWPIQRCAHWSTPWQL